MPSDIEIAQACEMESIVEVAAQAGIDEKYLEPYGRYMAKVDNISVLKDYADKPDGKLILVTAITPTPAGEGKTTTSVGLADGMRQIGEDVIVALRARLRHQGWCGRRRIRAGRSHGEHQPALYG